MGRAVLVRTGTVERGPTLYTGCVPGSSSDAGDTTRILLEVEREVVRPAGFHLFGEFRLGVVARGIEAAGRFLGTLMAPGSSPPAGGRRRPRGS